MNTYEIQGNYKDLSIIRQMHTNKVWLTFLFCFTLTVLIFSSLTLYHLVNYRLLTARTAPKNMEWKVVELSSDRFAYKANYTFEVKQRTYTGDTLFKDFPFKNRWGAEQILPQFSKENRDVWYQMSTPKHNSLQKKFPLKELISTGILWGLLAYFFWLGYYVKQR